MATFATTINNVPCICQVTRYTPAVPARLTGPMEDAVEAIPAEFDYTILDLNHQPAPELEQQVSAADEYRLQDEYEAYITAGKYDVDF